jgi:hypothetical protein
MDGTILKKRTAPFSSARFTSFISIASTSGADGRGLPIFTAVPISEKEVPFMVTLEAGSTDVLLTIGAASVVRFAKAMKKIEPRHNRANFIFI